MILNLAFKMTKVNSDSAEQCEERKCIRLITTNLSSCVGKIYRLRKKKLVQSSVGKNDGVLAVRLEKMEPCNIIYRIIFLSKDAFKGWK